MAQINGPVRAGWGYFASSMLVVVGLLQAIAGLAGIFKKGFYVVPQSHLLVFNHTAWGWINLVLGIVLFFAGLELLRYGARWAQAVAVLLVGLAVVANVTYVNAYPLWFVSLGVLDVLVLYALTVRSE